MYLHADGPWQVDADLHLLRSFTDRCWLTCRRTVRSGMLGAEMTANKSGVLSEFQFCLTTSLPAAWKQIVRYMRRPCVEGDSISADNREMPDSTLTIWAA